MNSIFTLSAILATHIFCSVQATTKICQVLSPILTSTGSIFLEVGRRGYYTLYPNIIQQISVYIANKVNVNFVRKMGYIRL